jgi:hypothetical protein
MDRHAEWTGPPKIVGPPIGVPRRPAGPLVRAASSALLGAVCGTACVSLWPTSHATVPAAPADVLACAAVQAKQLGYHVGPDTTHGSLTAEKARPFKYHGPDVTESSRQDVLALTLRPAHSSGGSIVTIEAESMEGRRGMAPAAITASAEVRADADTLLNHCRHAAPNTSLP